MWTVPAGDAAPTAHGGAAGRRRHGAVGGSRGGGERGVGAAQLAKGARGHLLCAKTPRLPWLGRLLRASPEQNVDRSVGSRDPESDRRRPRRTAGRCADDAGAYAPRDTVRAVVMDLSEAYRQAVQLVLPDAACVADKFHVPALAGRVLREVRGGRQQRGNVAWLLHRGVERLNDAECRQLVAALEADPALAKACALKEGLRSVYRCSTEAEAQAVLTAWVCDAQGSALPPFVRAGSTLRKWRAEVLNYWCYPLTNAVVEGKPNRVKVLKRRAYGYRNDATFLLRILNLVHTD